MSKKPKCLLYLDMRLTLSSYNDRRTGLLINPRHVEALNVLAGPNTTLWLVNSPDCDPMKMGVTETQSNSICRHALKWAGYKGHISAHNVPRSSYVGWNAPPTTAPGVTRSGSFERYSPLAAVLKHSRQFRNDPKWAVLMSQEAFALEAQSCVKLGVVNSRTGVTINDILNVQAIWSAQ